MGGKPEGFWLLFISQNGPPTAGRISLRSADSVAARDSSYSTSRRASPPGLDYFYSITWEATRLRSISGHILQDDPSIREEVLDSRLGGSVPRVLRFFLSPDFSGYSCQDFRWALSQSLQLNLRLGGYSIWSAILQSHFHISFGFKTTWAFLKTFEGSTRGHLGLLEKTSRLLRY
jgi:hypothetical protein